MDAIKSYISRYKTIRGLTESLCEPLETEDYVIQAMDDVSPPKWHLAHTTWFFETFVLREYCAAYRAFDNLFYSLFNSYYQKIGMPYPRHKRGILARPTVATIYEYRKYVDNELINYLANISIEKFDVIYPVLEAGLQHEQQHQELLLMDIKYNFYNDAHLPVYRAIPEEKQSGKNSDWLQIDGGKTEIGYDGKHFCFDNELSRHDVILRPYQITSRLVTNAEYIEFIHAGGYQNPEWWLADGWESVQKYQWHSPLYWIKQEGAWHVFTLNGLKKINPDEPVAHISYYEAEAYARWRDCRLPSEAEWENAALLFADKQSNFLENQIYHPQTAQHADRTQLFGDLWEWTTSAYLAYPGYQPLQGKLSEYNGKFMSNQMVLRGGSCVTPASHIRASYRNFFQPEKRWVFSGIRLAKNTE